MTGGAGRGRKKVTPAQFGKRIKLEVTGTAPDPNQPRKTTVFSASTAIVK